MKPQEKTVPGRVLILGLGGAIATVAGLLYWAVTSGGSTHVPLSKPGVGFAADDAAGARAGGEGALNEPGVAWDGGRIAKTLSDPLVREALRKRILAQWAEGEGEQASEAKAGRFAPAPLGPDGGAIDPKYIQSVVHEDFVPMATKCYDELLTRHDAAAGRVEMSFTIVADEKLGAIVEDAGVVGEGGVDDERMTTCLRESLTTLAFRPPAHGGLVTVVYPIDLSPGDAPPARDL